MRRTRCLMGLVICMAYSTTYAQDIKKESVTKIISTLAADDMEGRKTFEPGIEKAAQFLEKEFKRVGLQPLPGAKDFRQSFALFGYTPTSIALTINGVKVNRPLIIRGNASNIDWNQDSRVEITAADSQPTVMSAWRRARNPERSEVVWIDASEAELFEHMSGNKQFYNTAAEAMAGDSTKTTVFILKEEGDTAIQNWHLAATQELKEYALSNIVGIIPGKSKAAESVIFSGHYDHLGIIAPVGDDNIANGADDDASGVTAVIMLADYFKKRKPAPARTLVFVAFTAEEMGGHGSQYFSRQMAPESIVAMFNIEMIGKESKFGKNSAFITGFEKSDFGKILQRNLEGSDFKFYPDPYPEQQLFYRSDNATLAKLGVPAHTISTTQIDKDELYHSVKDEVATLDMENITRIIKAIAVSARSIVDGKDTPERLPLN
jgi:Zn-dependent M28 family amino/carboxypeptidase